MKTIVIGAGPAGLSAAIFASGENSQVLVLEKNEKAGKKLFITGKGRCNVTNDCTEKEFIQNVVSNPYFLFSSIHGFSSQDAMKFFSDNGVPLVVERGHRVFPKSYHAYDITNGLLYACQKKQVMIHLQEEVKRIQKEGDVFKVITNQRTYTCDNVVVATGGLAYPATGSTGDGYRFGEDFGHTLVACVPALTGIQVKERIHPSMIGFTLKNVSLSVKEGKFHSSEFGELTFREDYLDGPIALTLSSRVNRRNPSSLSLELDFKPALDEEKLLTRMQRDIDENPKENIYFLVKKLLPNEVVPFFFEISKLDSHGQLCSFDKEHRRLLIHWLKHFPFTCQGLNSFERAIVTSGGIATKEINPSTMESKLVPGLYFAGEVIDVDAYTGGFNIQIALSTGAAAGREILSRSENK